MTPVAYEEFLARHADKVQREGKCLVWTGARDDRGYGRVGVVLDGAKRVRFTHRIVYALVHGEIPPRTDVDHICHRPPCLNPEHLRASSHQENLRHRKGAQHQSATGVRGVRWRQDVGKYQARLALNGKEHSVGYFSSLDDAREAVTAARERFYGEFAGGA